MSLGDLLSWPTFKVTGEFAENNEYHYFFSFWMQVSWASTLFFFFFFLISITAFCPQEVVNPLCNSNNQWAIWSCFSSLLFFLLLTACSIPHFWCSVVVASCVLAILQRYRSTEDRRKMLTGCILFGGHVFRFCWLDALTVIENLPQLVMYMTCCQKTLSVKRYFAFVILYSCLLMLRRISCTKCCFLTGTYQ